MSCMRMGVALLLVCIGCGTREVELLARADAGGSAARDAGAAPSATSLRVIVGDAPSHSEELFARASSADVTKEKDAPRVLYPSHETTFARNSRGIVPQWSAPTALDLFELHIAGESLDLRFYTTELEVPAETSGLRDLATLAAGRSLTLRVRGLKRAEPERVFRSADITLHFSKASVPGTLYYWSTSAQGIMRAHLSSTTSTRFFTEPGAKDGATCTGCHAVSRDGRKLAVGYNGEHLREVGIPDRQALVPPGAQPIAPTPVPPGPKAPKPAMTVDQGPGYGFGVFNPSGTRLLFADKGELKLLDADTGMMLEKIELPKEHRATHPDWSPDGRYVVMTYGEKVMGNKDVNGTSLARMSVEDGDRFGEVEVLLQSEGMGDTLCFPTYSPDGRLLAFVRAKGKSKNNASAEVWLLAADGSGKPIALERANHRVVGRAQETDLANSMPSWAPSSDPAVSWLAFSSVRALGSRLTAGTRDQLWLSAIEPARITSGEDPSSAAFWLPFQAIDEDNHRALWTSEPEASCVEAAVEHCNSVDDDCDTKIDEACCTPVTEVCGNDQDDDCDGLIDDHCGCAQSDVCDNGLDDDCDTNVDEDCLI